MTREYIRVTPSRSTLESQTVTQQLLGLHGLGTDSQGIFEKINPLNGDPVPTFEFLAISEGENEPVEFYYGVDNRLDALEERLRTLYPATYTIDRAEIDLCQKLIPSFESDRADYDRQRDEERMVETDASGPNVSEPQPHPRRLESLSEQDSPVSDGGAFQDGGSGEIQPLFERPADTDDSAELIDIPAGDHQVSEHSPSTPTRDYLALDDVDPMGVSWHGSPVRRDDWMTTIQKVTETDSPDSGHSRAPLAQLIDQLTRATHPIAFQALFRQKNDWSHKAMERKRKLREGEDRLIDWFFSELLGNPEHDDHSPSNTGRQRQYLDIGGRERVESIDEKQPQHTFTVNLQAIALATPETNTDQLHRRLDDLSTVFDHLNGAHYRLVPRRLQRGLRKQSRANKSVTRALNRETTTGRWRKTRPELVFGPAELANFVVVPPSPELTTEGGRGSEATPESRNPLPLPSQEHIETFTGAGMTIGYGIGEDGDPTTQPIHIPPSLLPFHVGRFAKTGTGKSVALINDTLSLYGQTDGPVFLIDSKGGNLPDHYMRAHMKRFGVEDFENNVIHFSVPEILPGFAFFDIQPALASGVRRVDAIQDKADHYEEIIKLAMGPERYEEAIASPNLIKYLIKAMYDEEYGLENGHFRDNVDYFTHDQLETAVTQFHSAGPPDSTPEDAPKSSNPRIADKLERHLRSNPMTFTNIISGVSNRMDYVTQDAHLRRIFNNTESQFDFRDLLDDHQVVIFDLGELRDEAAKVMTGVILTSLYDAVKSRDPETLASKSDEYVANLLIDEAASVVVSDTLTTILEKGREFRLSVELVTQFPEQIREAGDREVYLNVLNNIGSPLVGKIAVDRDLAEALAHEELDPVGFKNRISSLPRGEWIAQLPSPEFGETGPDPFSLQPLPIPEGHPDGDYPLTQREEDRFQDALEIVHERTQAEYGVPELNTPPDADTAGEVPVEHGDDQPLEVAMARAIRAVQIKNDVRDVNDWVSVDSVDKELLRRIDTNEIEDRGYDTLPAVREASSLIEVALPEDTSTVMCRLTSAGEQAAEPDTSSSPTGGGEEHDRALRIVETALSDHNCSVDILDQNGAERPDAIVSHPQIDSTLQVEIETTTHVRPAKVLTNLRKAQKNDRFPLFVVTGDDDHSGLDIANRLRNILQEPWNRLRSGETRLYTTNTNVTFNGGASARNGVTAIRPATDNSRHTRWFQQNGDLVLEDGTGEEHARMIDIETASKDQFPATYSYDPDTGTYSVFIPGELPDTYESREAFEAEWVPIKRPFVPQTDLPIPDYTANSYAIAVITDQDTEPKLKLYDPTDHTTTDITTLIDAVADGTLHPAGSQPDRKTNQEDVGTETDSFGIESFTEELVLEETNSTIAVATVYQTYEQFATTEGYDVKPKNQFTQALRECVEFERDRKWLDGKSRRCYIGIDLREDSPHISSQDESV